MAWDFRTDPETERELAWIREMVAEIELLDLVRQRMSKEQWAAVTQPMKDAVKARGLWAAHLDPDLGGGGFGQLRLALMHEILGRTPSAPAIFGNQAPDSGNSELLAVGANPEQRERWLDAAARGQADELFRADRAAHRELRPDLDHDGGAPRRRRLGHQRPQVVRLQCERAPTSCWSSPSPIPRRSATAGRRCSSSSAARLG